MQILPDDYPALKAFFVWMTGNVIQPALGFSSTAVASLDSFEARSPATARKGLGMAIGDLIEDTGSLPPAEVATIDERLRSAGIITLSEVRARFWTKVRRIMERGAIRGETDYYALRNVVEALPEAEQQAAWALLAAHETKVAAR